MESGNPPLVIAHRGASDEAPENTLAAFDRANRLAVDMEFDVQLSADGVPVVFHDKTLERTSSGRGRLADLSLAELKALDAGSWFSPRFRGERIPTLVEVLDLTRERCIRIVELKSPSTREARTSLVRAVGRVLRRTPERTMVTSFDRPLVDGMRAWKIANCPSREVDFALNLDGPPRQVSGHPWRVRGRYRAVCPHRGLVTPHRVAEWTSARRGGDRRLILAWTADSAVEWLRLLKGGVDGIMTNRPGALRRWLHPHA